eukprot:CAMPEP_0198209562 /NCGR_PEP_ID=MMETSP1445-20131203/16979_1 /TAXON_ID=36898 /ORGANISM="Pyramimonas sp., Strain CCMP2087" /LENGTH=73 /DNA_ID=CAMNT_0043883383 /DNA_START=402 /DNA_END=623 /DNA_ORIENTATION=+
MADAIEDAYPSVMVDGNPAEVNPRPGSFEVTLEDGTLLYSSLQAKKFPTEREMLTAVEEVRLERSPSSGGGCS